eukprot:1032579-Rhodomonas_salina.1
MVIMMPHARAKTTLMFILRPFVGIVMFATQLCSQQSTSSWTGSVLGVACFHHRGQCNEFQEIPSLLAKRERSELREPWTHTSRFHQGCGREEDRKAGLLKHLLRGGDGDNAAEANEENATPPVEAAS